MIISKTPYRVSFAGGGTDLPAFCDHEPGAVLSCAIDHHIHVAINRRFEDDWLIRGVETERVGSVDEIRHDLVRETIKLVGVEEPLEITMVGDVPGGTGLGSSSSLTVGLLKALHAYRDQSRSPALVAEEACRIEIDILRKPIGRQDQYAAAFGGVNVLRFAGKAVAVQPIPAYSTRLLPVYALLFYTGRARNADGILRKQSEATRASMDTLRKMRDFAGMMAGNLFHDAMDSFCRMLHESWELKRSLGCGIATGTADEWYRAARKAGAWGGKLLGAGGGGFLLVMAPPDRHEAIREALGRPRELAFRIDPHGSRLVAS